MVGTCLRAAERLRHLYGLRVGVINARFVKPLDRETVSKAIEECGFVLTVEDGCLMGGFGSAVLEAANDAGLSTSHVRRLGLPDRYVLHAERDEQLAEVGLDVEGITKAAIALARTVGLSIPEPARGPLSLICP
jgi:1-deoxy-D-xylulose-5-phosphate synthase